MPIRYHAQRKHIIYSLDALLYELHALSFLLAPSVLVLLCRCTTQFQFARVRELDGRRPLAFWLALVLLVNVGGVWAHASIAEGEGGKGIVLDFVGMGRRPSKTQLLLLDATIMFLQAILTTIAYETSLALAMPADVVDPLFPAATDSSAPPSPIILPEPRTSETAAFLPYSSAVVSADASMTYPPTRPPIPSSSSPSFESSTKASMDPVPPSIPIINLSLRHIIHRLTSPVPTPPPRTDGLDGEDDELGVLRLPLPNTTSVRVAHTLRILQQARARRRERERQEARRPRGNASRGSGDGVAGGSANANGRGRGRRIPGAIVEEEDEGE
ncbi:uncharacterized protein FOMMEDRAFT_19965 [Fomitiporia mediterranea MF3/22]|uniref:uncharacterized protein n=1 Tax=Fomitiporia mediterranea (strain MF3/22) TaxID=694068 RepID=UPI00044074FD|nr:uncharacterized protein FOMMEDRAFT_19965 [Fomitiporia mediterranea MF3/22]EJD02686.1 hypothetical protein FOMMEDRAFT_19965 [Fomitiporia mediterranea MF3/22]